VSTHATDKKNRRITAHSEVRLEGKALAPIVPMRWPERSLPIWVRKKEHNTTHRKRRCNEQIGQTGEAGEVAVLHDRQHVTVQRTRWSERLSDHATAAEATNRETRQQTRDKKNKNKNKSKNENKNKNKNKSKNENKNKSKNENKNKNENSKPHRDSHSFQVAKVGKGGWRDDSKAVVVQPSVK
jgi:hypothetical protein